MENQMKFIKSWQGKKTFHVWDNLAGVFEEINHEQFEALARYSTCGEFKWQIAINKSRYFNRIDCFLEPKWRD